jgi:hypothetical protein
MNEWQPIDAYDILKNKPKNAVFLFAQELEIRDSRKVRLDQCLGLSRHMGYRTCTHWFALPELNTIKS